MKRLGIIIGILLLCLTLVNATACNPFGGEEEVTEHWVEVVQGDLTVTVSGSGNIEIANEIKLAFGIGGRIDKIYVDEGDEVSKGEVLAKLETDAVELALTEAQVAQNKAQVAVTQTQVAITEAQLAQQTAEYELEQTQETYTLSDIKAAQAAVDAARRDWEEALWTLYKYDPGTPGWEEYQKIVNQTQLRLNAAEDKLDAMLSGADTEEVAIKKRKVELAQQSLELAQQSLELNQQSLQLAQQSLNQAQKQLDEAIITAPFDGIVAEIYVDEEDVIPSPTMSPKTIVHLIDPSSMQLEVQVDEIDIAEAKVDQRAIIEVDALPALLLEGKVSSISLLPETVGGVIVYDVEITFDVAEGVGIRAGMSATADIIIAERSNVLLVPDRAVKQDSQGNNIVEVKIDKQIEERVVVIGISDGYQTEILTGLEEGEMVVEKRAKTQSSGGGLF